MSVQSIYENNRVYTVQNDRLIGHQVVRVGEHESSADGYRVLIESPALLPGDAIITTQLPKAITGLRVEIANTPDAPDTPAPIQGEASALAKAGEVSS